MSETTCLPRPGRLGPTIDFYSIIHLLKETTCLTRPLPTGPIGGLLRQVGLYIYILDPEVKPIPNIKFVLGSDHSGSYHAKKLRQGSTLSRHFELKLLPEVAQIQSPFLLFHGLHDEKRIFHFRSKLRA